MSVRQRSARAPGEADKPGVLEYGYWLFLVLAVGRLGQLVPALGAIPAVKLVMGVTIAAIFVSWRRLPRVAVPAAAMRKNALLLVAIAVVLTPFSFWRGASREFVLQELPVLAAGTCSAYFMARSWRSLRGSFLALVLCGAILAVSAISGYKGGRAATDTMYDPNDLAYLLVTVFPLAMAFFFTARGVKAKLMYGGIGAVLLLAILLTQSRGGLLGLITVVLAMALVPMKANWTTRKDGRRRRSHNALAMLLVAVCMATVVWSVLPDAARARFGTLLHISQDYNMKADDITGRGSIWKRGVTAALERPVGYGPNSFGMVDFRFGGKMKAPHNSFLQVLVELGFLGALLFLRMYYLALLELHRARRRLATLDSMDEQQEQLVVFARALQFALLGNAVAGFFLSMAYAIPLWVLFGTVMAVTAIIDQTVRKKASSAVQQPHWFRPRVAGAAAVLRGRQGGYSR